MANTNRFFKLFPMIGEEDVGLAVYAEWLAGIVRSKTGALSAKSESDRPRPLVETMHLLTGLWSCLCNQANQ